MGFSLSIFFIPPIKVWFEVPNLKSNPTFKKLKSVSSGLCAFARKSVSFKFDAIFKTGVLFKNISVLQAVLYAAFVDAIPLLCGVANPAISPSEITSTIVINCLLDKASDGRSGLLRVVFWSNRNCYWAD